MDPTQIFYFPQVGDGTAGDIRLQTTLIFVNTGEATQVRMEFFDSSGNPLALTLDGFGSVAELEIPLGKGEAISLRTSGQDPLKVGYARVSTSDRVGGTARLRSDGCRNRPH